MFVDDALGDLGLVGSAHGGQLHRATVCAGDGDLGWGGHGSRGGGFNELDQALVG